MSFLTLLQLFLALFSSMLFADNINENETQKQQTEQCTADSNECGNNNNSDTESLDVNDEDFDLLNFDASAYDYGEFDCPGLSAGWTCDYSADYSSRDGDHYFCDVDTISADMSVEEFNSKYLFKKPVLINTTIEDWADPSFWSKKSLVKKYGNFLFEAGRSLELVLNSGIGSTAISLRDWLRDPMSLHLDKDVSGPYDGPFKEPLYIFDRSIWNEETNFKDKHFNAPPFLANGEPEYGILFLGPTGTGATWHGHGETWAAEAYGRKRWMLYPPELHPPGGFWPGYSAKDWYYNVYPYLSETINMSNVLEFNIKEENYRHSIFERKINGETVMINEYSDIFKSDNDEWNNVNRSGLYKPLECIQKEGQILYLPEFWFHAVLNLGDVVAAGIQTSRSYTQWMQEIDLLGQWEKEMNDDGQKKLHKPPLTDLENEIRKWNLLKLYQRLEEMSPNVAIRPFMIGYTYYDLGQREQAIRKMTEALKLDPFYMEAYSNLGRIYLDSTSESQRKKGEHLWRIAYMLNHNNPRIRDNLIDLFETEGRHDLAELVLKHEKLPPMEDFRAVRKEKFKQRRKDRQSKYREKYSRHTSDNKNNNENNGNMTNEDEFNSDENMKNIPASAESVVSKGDSIKSEHYGNEDVIDTQVPEPTEHLIEERMNEPRRELPPGSELGNMVNSVI